MDRSGPGGPLGPQPPLLAQPHSGPLWTKLRHFPDAWVQLGVYICSHFLLGGLAGCVNLLAVVWTWWNAEGLINVRQNRK